MKRLLAFVFLLAFALLGAEVEETGRLEFNRFHIQPTRLGFSLFDYMHGGQNGVPMRIQGTESVFMTYMRQNSSAVRRRQRWAWIDTNGNGLMGNEVNFGTTQIEGFGSLALDPVTNDPFYVWHADYIRPEASSRSDVHIRHDAVHLMGTPGQIWSQVQMVIDNSSDDNTEDFMFRWPVIHVGPSPIEGKNRIYIFTLNAGFTSHQTTEPTPENPSGRIQSSAAMLSFADYANLNGQVLGDPNELDWNHRIIPYLIDTHRWNPEETGIATEGDFRSVRAYPSFTVSGSIVVLAGHTAGNSTDWSGLERHDHFIIYCDNYGEFREDEYTVRTFDFSNRLPEGIRPIAMLNDREIPILGIDNRSDGLNVWNFRTTPGVLNNKTIIVDSRGRIQFPIKYHLLANLGENNEILTYPLTHTIHNAIYDPLTGEVEFSNIMPRTTPMITERPVFPWGTHDQYIREDFIVLDPSEELVLEWHLMNYPFFFGFIDSHTQPRRLNQFHINHVRLSEDDDGLIAMMWMDSAKSLRHNLHTQGQSPYADWAEVPEIMISISLDSGQNWSEPYRMSKFNHDELLTHDQGIPSYVWPADRVLRVDENTVRLFFMYTEDLSYGTFTQNEGLDLGSYINFTAVDFDVRHVTNSGADRVLRPQEAMLAQNFPNPFNPNTTINFNIPSTGQVNLSIFNVRGQLVKTLVNDVYTAGNYSIAWNGVDDNNRSVSSGIYFYRLEAAGRTEVRRMLLMK